MFDYLATSHKDSDYTIMITLVCWPKCMNFGPETHLGVGDMSTFVFPLGAIIRAIRISLAIQLSGKAHEDSDYTAMNTVVH